MASPSESEFDGNGLVYDPVDQAPMKKSSAFAFHGDLFFGSLETQQVYYRLVESGFELAVVGDKPVLRPRVRELAWEKTVSLRSSNSSSDGHFEVRDLSAGEYTFTLEAQAADLSLRGSLAASITGARRCTAKLAVRARDTGEVIAQAQLRLRADKDVSLRELKFSVGVEQQPATMQLDVSSNSLLKAVKVLCKLDCLEMSKTKKEVSEARNKSIIVARSDEYMVEVTKGSAGMGVTLAWDKDMGSVVVRSVERNGAAALTRKISAGDLIRGIQGERVEDLSFKQAIGTLRNVPSTVVLLMTPAPPDYVTPERSPPPKVHPINTPLQKQQPQC